MYFSTVIIVAVAAFLAVQAVPFSNSYGNIDEQGPYFGGDMIMSPEQLGELKSGIIGNNYRWPKGQMPLVIDPAFTKDEKKTVMDAIYEIQNKTCIRFPTRTNQVNFTRIVRGTNSSGCYSNVGRQGGNQTVNIQPGNPGCVFLGIIAHELIHAIGFVHEHMRTDRDDFVLISFENIQDGAAPQFTKYDNRTINPYGSTYDYGSVMHYSSTAFSKNGKNTITPTKSGVSASSLGQRNGLSSQDALKINNMYKNCTVVL